jgi:hypothetical protein
MPLGLYFEPRKNLNRRAPLAHTPLPSHALGSERDCCSYGRDTSNFRAFGVHAVSGLSGGGGRQTAGAWDDTGLQDSGVLATKATHDTRR